MTASAATSAPGTPVTDPLALALWAILDDAIGWRQPVNGDCCDEEDMCEDHQADEDRAAAMTVLLKRAEQAFTREEALAVLRDADPALLLEIAGEHEDTAGGARDGG